MQNEVLKMKEQFKSSALKDKIIKLRLFLDKLHNLADDVSIIFFMIRF